ncbi:MAG: hypothetical protein KKH92_06575 [Firmicutes bacterium]|nr:hypothetical protein [Bacillota bacterium]
MKLVPTKKQFNNWSLPSKATYIAFVLAIVAIILSLLFFLIQIEIGASNSGQEKTHEKLDTIDGKLSKAIDNKVNTPIKKRTSFENQFDSKPVDKITKLVSTLESLLLEDNAEIKSPDYIEDKTTGELRKIDISIRKKIGSVPILIMIECKDDSISDDTLWIEQIAQKRDALKASKAVAVFNGYLNDNAIQKALYLNVETRLISKITSDDVSSWLHAKYMTQWIYNVDFLRVSFKTEKEEQGKLHELIKKNFSNKKLSTDKDIFLNSEDNKNYSFNHIWKGILSKKREEIYMDVYPKNGRIRRTLMTSFSNPNSRYQILSDNNKIDILKIKIICDLWIEEKLVPFNINEYSSEDNQLVDTIGVQFEANEKKYNLNIHKDLKSGNMYISGDNLTNIDFDFKEVNENTLTGKDREITLK